jgi:hypothetical protein
MQRPETARVAPDEIRLECRHFVERDQAIAQRPASRVDAVQEAIGRLQPQELCVCRLDMRPYAWRHRHLCPARDLRQRLERQRRRWREHDRLSHAPNATEAVCVGAIRGIPALNGPGASGSGRRMPRLHTLHLIGTLLAALTLAACRGPEVPNAMTGTTR